MRLTWPDKKIALEIVGGPTSDQPHHDKNGWTIIRASYEDLQDRNAFSQLMTKLLKRYRQEGESYA